MAVSCAKTPNAEEKTLLGFAVAQFWIAFSAGEETRTMLGTTSLEKRAFLSTASASTPSSSTCEDKI